MCDRITQAFNLLQPSKNFLNLNSKSLLVIVINDGDFHVIFKNRLNVKIYSVRDISVKISQPAESSWSYFA